jgi:hypothetical protein
MVNRCYDNLVTDHIVPISVITDEIYKLRRRTKSQIGLVILQRLSLAIITPEEHDKLRCAGLYDRMPGNWDRKNIFARYDQVGIFLKNNRYTELRSRGGGRRGQI